MMKIWNMHVANLLTVEFKQHKDRMFHTLSTKRSVMYMSTKISIRVLCSQIWKGNTTIWNCCCKTLSNQQLNHERISEKRIPEPTHETFLRTRKIALSSTTRNQNVIKQRATLTKNHSSLQLLYVSKTLRKILGYDNICRLVMTENKYSEMCGC